MENTLTYFKERCKSAGLKVTHQRLEIFCGMMYMKTHPSAEEVYQEIKPILPALSLDTVYRTLATFEEHGIIRRVHTLDGKGRFDANLEPHHHLVCEKCKSIRDFYHPAFDTIPLPEEASGWGEIGTQQVKVIGICNPCLQERSCTNPKQ